jgi:hypothetical protein
LEPDPLQGKEDGGSSDGRGNAHAHP